jgi:hypothetical protein
MSSILKAGFTGLAAMALLSTALLLPADARIRCQGEFQITQKYGLIATPYCGDEEIARVANNYGWRVSPAEVHNNPLTKVYLCQTIGYDWRLQSPCVGYSLRGHGGR